jgi:hypothetical protein
MTVANSIHAHKTKLPEEPRKLLVEVAAGIQRTSQYGHGMEQMIRMGPAGWAYKDWDGIGAVIRDSLRSSPNVNS